MSRSRRASALVSGLLVIVGVIVGIVVGGGVLSSVSSLHSALDIPVKSVVGQPATAPLEAEATSAAALAQVQSVARAGTALQAEAAVTAPYPPAVCSTIAVSTTTPFPGQKITVTGSGFLPNSAVSLVVDTAKTVIGSATASAAGTFTTTVTIPLSLYGAHVLIAAGGLGVGCPADPFTVLQLPAAPATSSSGLAFTGADVIAILIAGVALVGAGVALQVSSRRRKSVAGA
jgi:hypothetical protein